MTKNRIDTSADHGKIYRKYIYPDGRVLYLTQKEFDQTVEIFRLLLKAEGKTGKKPVPPSNSINKVNPRNPRELI